VSDKQFMSWLEFSDWVVDLENELHAKLTDILTEAVEELKDTADFREAVLTEGPLDSLGRELLRRAIEDNTFDTAVELAEELSYWPDGPDDDEDGEDGDGPGEVQGPPPPAAQVNGS
jgi:hypothetical protein